MPPTQSWGESGLGNLVAVCAALGSVSILMSRADRRIPVKLLDITMLLVSREKKKMVKHKKE